jgi:hypothetical protein
LLEQSGIDIRQENKILTPAPMRKWMKKIEEKIYTLLTDIPEAPKA